MKCIMLTCLAVLATASVAQAAPGPAINGVMSSPRVFNDIPGSTLAIVNSNSVNAGLSSVVAVTDTFAGQASGANRHDFLLSGDGGATAQAFGIDDSFTFQTSVNLAPLNNTPRKEAGIRLNSPGFGDALLIVNSDAGEIVAFGGPFYRFDSPGNTYVSGTTITLGFTLQGAGDGIYGTPTTIQYFIDRDGPGAVFGVESSPVLPYTNLEGGLPAYTVAMYAQGGPGGPPNGNLVDANSAVFSDIMYTAIPEPSTALLSIVALAGLGAVRRRR